MSNNKLTELHQLGQSLWYDNIARDLLDSGEIQKLIDEGVLGMTSNPAIFKQAITGGAAYDTQLRELALAGKSASEIYEALAIEDIRRAADILHPIYVRSQGIDGYVSLEVSPLLAHDTSGTITEAARLFKAVDRPNLMIKIPATEEGLPAIEQTITDGINVNVTLIFSLKMYAKVMDAYMKGLERRVEVGQPVSDIASVASFFVSRVDTLVDKLLDDKIAVADASEAARLRALQGKAAVANAKLAYQLFKETFGTERFARLAAEGARVQRPLWASTSTKNPAYRDVIYVEELIGPDTINTAPPQTIEAFRDHGQVTLTLEKGVAEAQAVLDELAAIGIDMDVVTDELLRDGVKKFVVPFEELLAAIEAKRRQFVGETAVQAGD